MISMQYTRVESDQAWQFDQAWIGYKLFTKVISMPQEGKELKNS